MIDGGQDLLSKTPLSFLNLLTFYRILGRAPRSFYQKRRNEEIAAHLKLADIAGTDLGEIINELKTRTAQARQY